MNRMDSKKPSEEGCGCIIEIRLQRLFFLSCLLVASVVLARLIFYAAVKRMKQGLKTQVVKYHLSAEKPDKSAT